MKRVDLHTHSRYSDGTSPPQDVVAMGADARVDILVLTDHDSVSGFPEALAAGRDLGVDVRCGIEINTIHQDSVHILGYGVRFDDAAFAARLSEFRARRVKRVRLIVENLQKEGLPLTFEDVENHSHETLGRPHIADALRRKGLVSSRQEAFNRFLIPGRPGYVKSMGPTVEEAISLIREAGGFCSIAHPETVPDISEIGNWARLGLEGLEVYYSTHTPSEIARFKEAADRFGLLCTGGTDFHGPGSGRDKSLGVDIPDEAYHRFMKRLSSCG